MLQIEAVQVFHKSVEILMRRVIEKIPVQLPLLVPLPEMSQLISHEIKLLSRMRIHIHIERSCLRELLLIISVHFLQYCCLPVDNFVMGQREQIPLIIVIDKGECQLMIVPCPVLGSCPEIIQSIIHPSHIPLIVESKAPFFHGFCDARK